MTDLAVGFYYESQDSRTKPAHYVSLEEARQLKASGQAYFINHGKDIRCAKPAELDLRLEENHGSMRDAWKIMRSGPVYVWQMPRVNDTTPR